MYNLFSITHTCITACARHAAEEVAAEEEEEEERLASAAAAVAWAIGARRRCWEIFSKVSSIDVLCVAVSRYNVLQGFVV